MDTNLITKVLSHLNLDESESIILAFLMTGGSQNITDLSKQLSISRQKLYRILESLEAQNLITKNLDQKYYSSISPSVIMARLRDSQIRNKAQVDSFDKVLPELLAYYYSKPKEPYVNIFEGRDKYLEIMNKVLDEASDEILILGNMEKFIDLVGSDYNSLWINNRIKKGIKVRMLTFEIDFVKEFRSRDKEELREVKYLDNKWKSDSVIWICGAKTLLWNPIMPRVIYLDDFVISIFFKNMFDMMYS
jgi:sugar-specific transcriptional regulator TrmB